MCRLIPPHLCTAQCVPPGLSSCALRGVYRLVCTARPAVRRPFCTAWSVELCTAHCRLPDSSSCALRDVHRAAPRLPLRTACPAAQHPLCTAQSVQLVRHPFCTARSAQLCTAHRGLHNSGSCVLPDSPHLRPDLRPTYEGSLVCTAVLQLCHVGTSYTFGAPPPSTGVSTLRLAQPMNIEG